MTYEDILRARLLRLVKIGQELKQAPLESLHVETGLPVFIVLGMVMDAAGYTELELREVRTRA